MEFGACSRGYLEIGFSDLPTIISFSKVEPFSLDKATGEPLSSLC